MYGSRILWGLLLLCAFLLRYSHALDLPQHKQEKCHSSFFECYNTLCIKGSLRCNHVDDCGDNSDEANCDSKSTPTSCPSGEYLCQNPPMCVPLEDLCTDFNQCQDYDCSVSCQPHKFKCLNESQCVPKKYLCDGNADCVDGSDELHCDDEKYKCDEEADSFLCDDHSACIFTDDVCDGHEMCDDGSDEKNDCHKLCEEKKCGQNQLCLPEGRGVKCVCHDGFQFDKDKNCVEHKYCNASDLDRPCSQICVEGHFGRGPQCRCVFGYDLDRDGRSCNAKGSEAILYVATSEAIHQWSVKTQSYSNLIGGLGGVTGLAVDGIGRRIFWSEYSVKGQPEVFSMEIDGGERTKTAIASFGLQKPEGLAFDFITKHLYVVDSGVPAILACELQLKHCVTVFNSTVVTSPKDLVLHPAQGLLYYTETGSDPVAIMRGSMDGSSSEVLVSLNVHRPTSLHIDYTTDRLYWIDTFYGRVFKVDLDGTNKMPVLSHKVTSPTMLCIFEDSLFWVRGQSKDVMAANKFTGNNSKTVFKTDGQPTALVVEHKSLQNDHAINRCESKRCHLCLLNAKGTGSCFCKRGHQVSLTEQYCERIETPSFLLAADKTQILRLPLNTTGRPTLSYIQNPSLNNVYALAYLSKSHEILYSNVDPSNGKAFIGRIRGIDGNAQSEKVVEDLGSVQSIAVDESSSLVFWTDYVKKSISVASLDGSSFKTQLPIDVSTPYGLTVDTVQGLLYYSDKNPAVIKRCLLDGQSCSRLVWDRLDSPNYLLVQGQQLFWSDYRLGEISSIDQWGNDRETVVSTGGFPRSFAIDNNILYWTEDDKNSIFYKHIHTVGGYESSIETQGMTLTGLVAAVPHTLPQSACTFRNGGCEQICISIKRSMEVSCLCMEGFKLHQDGKQCVRRDAIQCKGFLCKMENRCIDSIHVCDGFGDCQDSSDENNCLDTCSDYEFKCANGKCISEHFKCDGDDDCKDGSDENPELCPDSCPGDYYACDGNRCIPETFVCDNEQECEDGTDEENCPYVKCDDDEFSCGENQCIIEEWLCDGSEDCEDGRDEVGCQSAVCKDDEFRCHDGDCIDKSEVCDEIENCMDGEDERSCPVVEVCTEREFQCYDGECIHKSAKCDEVSDCSSHEDEEDCENHCSTDDFQCEDGSCVSIGKRCNRVKDCPDGSDEGSFCGPVVLESKNETAIVSENRRCHGFTCGSGHCVDADTRCDGKSDCRDNTDEFNCKMSCKNFNKCGQICVDTLSGVRCECESGYRLMADGFACEDIDECKTQNGGCCHKCVNVKGLLATTGLGYKCQCFQGFERGQDYYSCKVRGKRPELYVTSLYGIKKFGVEGQHRHESTVFITATPTRLAVDVRRGLIFWTSFIQSDSSMMNLFVLKNPNQAKKLPEIIHTGIIFDLAVDWITGNLYILHVDTMVRIKISVIATTTTTTTTSTTTTNSSTPPLLHTISHNPQGLSPLLLHPTKGLMFLLSFQYGPSIVKASMNGLEASPMRQASLHMHRAVNVMSLDVTTDRLYWIHPIFGQLKSVTVDDTDVLTYDLLTNTRQFLSMDIFEGIAYFSSQDDSIRSFATFKGEKGGLTVVAKVGHPQTIRVSHPLKQPLVSNGCQSKECMYMCVMSRAGAQCVCPDQYKNQHNPNCQGKQVEVSPVPPIFTKPVETTVNKDTTITTSPTPAVVEQHVEQTGKAQRNNNTLVFRPSRCELVCLHGGQCVTRGNTEACRCSKEFEGPLCERRREGEGKKKVSAKEEEEESFAWVAGLVIGLALVLFLVMLALWYYKYKRHNRSLMSSIHFKKQNKFVICNQDDKEGLVPEISFGNPGFQEEIDEEAHLNEDQDWWKKLLSRSRRSVDSAFHSKNSLREDGMDGCMKGDPQDPAMSDKVRLLK